MTLPVPVSSREASVPAMVQSLGPAACFAWDEFFSGQLRNRHTRMAYTRAVRQFLAWLPKETDLTQVSPGMIGRFFDQHRGSVPSKKLALAALRAFFDVMVNRHVCILNPAATVRGERYQVIEGLTPEMTAKDARQLLDSIPRDRPIDLRDRCIIGTLIFTAARAGAVANLKHKDLICDGASWTVRFAEKGGKRREIPVRIDLQKDLEEYLAIACHEPKADSSLFTTLKGRSYHLSHEPMSVSDIGRMVKRRLLAAGLSSHLCSHSFRVGTVTNLLSQGVPLEEVQYLAGHSDPRTTRLYDRRTRQVTRNLVERISI